MLGLNGAFAAALAILSTVLTAGATEVMHRPDNFNKTPNSFPLEAHPRVHIINKRAGQKVQTAYFTNWGIYGANFQPQDVDPTQLTHILYSFADISPDTGDIKLTDSYADEQKHYPTDSWDETGNNLYGCLKQFFLMKMANRNLKVMLSIGGWTYSQSGHFGFVTSPTSRATFVNDAVQLIEDYGFDGVDLDFEYPSSAAQGQGFADLLTELRSAFDSLAAKKGDSTPYEISAAVSAGAENYANLVVPQMNAALTHWNLMAYDYAGSWLTFADNQANLFGGERTNVSTDKAVKHFLSAGASASKMTMGIPLYGRAFENTDGIGQPYSGIGPGTIEAGVYSYSALPIAGAQVFEDTVNVASYSYDSAKRELVSYDTPHIVQLKTQYVNTNGMAGNMYWELSTDKKGADSLVGVGLSNLGALQQVQNHISFPDSKWDNIRNQMSGSTGGSTGGGSTGGGSTGGTGCSAAAWSSTSVYTGGQQATFNGHVWTAKWWTQGETPGQADVWTDSGAC
ncbi:hypothetical protein K435DRAFT_720591 [Dendrothele bispora CBS 962.96]|uniref:chitinase n=1 Tax=Dendrothele bispora (strain CBS 962.96) TaxID=1314807 RepID=A0A4V4HGF9_DENBC|nr:hypothetical protein K435DRAFT_720591 [Dendrothele bispora CBS 962.96]